MHLQDTTAQCVIDLMRAFDNDGDGHLSSGEFQEMLRWYDETLDGLDADVIRSGLFTVEVVDVATVSIDEPVEDTASIEEQWSAYMREEEQTREDAEKLREELDRARIAQVSSTLLLLVPPPPISPCVSLSFRCQCVVCPSLEV